MDETRSNKETYYVLWHDKKGYYTEFDFDGRPETIHNLSSGDIYSTSNCQRLKDHLIEYADRLHGFVIVEVDLEITESYTGRVFATLDECYED